MDEPVPREAGQSPRHQVLETHQRGVSAALSAAGFTPLGVVFGNASVHLARPVTLGAESRVTGAWRGFGGDQPEEVPSSIRTAQGWAEGATSGPAPAPFIASFPCPVAGAPCAGSAGTTPVSTSKSLAQGGHSARSSTTRSVV